MGRPRRVLDAEATRVARSTYPWRPEYVVELGLRPVAYNDATGDVEVAECGFCACFGREPRGLGHGSEDSSDAAWEPRAKKRARTQTVASWSLPYRTDNIRSHHKQQHPTKWAAYGELLALARPSTTAANGNDPSNGNGDSADIDVDHYRAQLQAFFAQAPPRAADKSAAMADAISKTDPVRATRSRRSTVTTMATATATATATGYEAEPPRRKRGRPVGSKNKYPRAPRSTSSSSSSRPLASKPTTTATTTATAAPTLAVTAVTPSLSVSLSLPIAPAPTPSPAPAVAAPVVALVDISNGALVTDIVAQLGGTLSNGQTTRFLTRRSHSHNSFVVAVPDEQQYLLVQQLLAARVPLSQLAAVLRITQPSTAAASVDGSAVVAYAQCVVAAGLQMVSELMAASWTYALRLHVRVGPHNRLMALDMRVRVPSRHRVAVDEFHILTFMLPTSPSSTSSVDVAALVDTRLRMALQAMDTQWTHKLLGISWSGDVHALGGHTALLPRLLRQVPRHPYTHPPTALYRVYDGAMALQTTLALAWKRTLADSESRTVTERDASDGADIDGGLAFWRTLRRLVAVLRGQHDWAARHGQCPPVATQSLASVDEVLSWLVTRRDAIQSLDVVARTTVTASSEQEATSTATRASFMLAAFVPTWWWLAARLLSQALRMCQQSVQQLSRDHVGRTSIVGTRERATLLIQALMLQYGISAFNTATTSSSTSNSNDSKSKSLSMQHTQQLPREDQEPGEQADDALASLIAAPQWIRDETTGETRLGRFKWAQTAVGSALTAGEPSLTDADTNSDTAATPACPSMAGARVVSVVLLTVLHALDALVTTSTDTTPSRLGLEDHTIPSPPPTSPLEFIAVDDNDTVDVVEFHSRTPRANSSANANTNTNTSSSSTASSVAMTMFLDSVVHEIRGLRQLVHSTPALEATLTATAQHSDPLTAAWTPLRPLFPHLCTFAAGLATVLPHICTDAGMMEQHEDDELSVDALVDGGGSAHSDDCEVYYRHCTELGDLTLEARRHAQQLEHLQDHAVSGISTVV